MVFLIHSFEKIINHYLRLDPESSSRLTVLEGKKITLILLGTGIVFYLKIENNGITICPEGFDCSDVTIKGTPLSLLQVSLNKKNRTKLFAEDVSIEGNLELGRYIINLFDEMEIDWEEYLSKIIGDIPANQTGRALDRLKNLTLRLTRNIFQNIDEYVHEEINLFPPREALMDFFNDIDIVRMDADRLQARLNYLHTLIEEEK